MHMASRVLDSRMSLLIGIQSVIYVHELVTVVIGCLNFCSHLAGS